MAVGQKARDIAEEFRSRVNEVPFPPNSPRTITNGCSALDQASFAIGPNLEKGMLSCGGVWLAPGTEPRVTVRLHLHQIFPPLGYVVAP